VAQSVADYYGPLDPTGNHWQIDWSSGVTEPGSSGSCIFGSNTSRCFGQLHGGPSACGVAASDLHDFYGKLAVSWNGGGTSATRPIPEPLA
jgi:lysyl endopeptidase